jgi:tRNA/tmRNA/rRNA uracil-C5-methylase (TrmA/RlmC/RlmD family)
VSTALSGLEAKSSGFDLCVLDPPRAGAAEILTSLVALAPRAIAYFSCDPVTLARDLRTLSQQGYALDTVQAFDMFPGSRLVVPRVAQGVSAKQ